MADKSKDYSIQGYNLAKLLKRLEEATARLEDVTLFQEGYLLEKYGPKPAESTSTSSLNLPSKADGYTFSDADGSKSFEDPLVQSTTPASPALKTEANEDPKSIVEFKTFIANNVKPLVTISSKIDPVVEEAAKLYETAYLETLKFLTAAVKSSKPNVLSAEFAEALKPITAKMMAISDLKDKNRSSKFYSYLNSIAEGASVFSWITVTTPMSIISDFKEAAQFWTNKVLKEFKDTDPSSAEWVKTYLKGFDALKQYVKEYHTTGPSWKVAGGIPLSQALKEVTGEGSTESATSGNASGNASGPPPPPPPPPPASVFEVEKETSKAPESQGMNAVFASLNQGENITAGLKKVDKSKPLPDTTKKTAPIPSSKTPTGPIKPKKPENLKTKKPPKKEMSGSKWFIENFENTLNEPIVIEGNIDESVFIGKCKSVLIQVTGKVNAITVNDCADVNLVLDNSVSGVEFIKCNKFAVQVNGSCPQITIDKCDNGTIYLSKDSIEASICTSSSTSLNVNLPVGEDEDFVEFPVPEQMVHKYDSKKLKSTVYEHAG
ncbi:Adenylyl cyclase-associated protein [Hanseniaspora osmophila]|uniref:Adenylyl cyclase-associated protein n=1 Tax=Hanseniaspora osmophila TaxID=56408 RepID=A0A1E5RNW2_9ASCO|nr:Adenylyl cyclase-associated protein [Hanseniaspora osmophila]